MPRKIIATTAMMAATAATLIAAPAADAAGRGANHVHVTKKHTVVSAATLRPGLARLRNDGARPVAVFRKKHDGVDLLVKYMNADDGSRLAKKAFTRFGFVEILLPHADDYVRLSKGSYYLVDVSGSKVKAQGVRSVAVRGTRANVSRPASTRVLRITGRGAVSGATTGAAKPYLRIENRTSAPRALETLRIKAAATAAEVADALAHPSTEKILNLVDTTSVPFAAVGVVGAHRDVTVRAPLGRGRYIVVTLSPSSHDLAFRYPHLLTLA